MTARSKRWAQHDNCNVNIPKIRPPTILCFELSAVSCLKESSDSLLASNTEILGDKNLTEQLHSESGNLDRSLLNDIFHRQSLNSNPSYTSQVFRESV